ncbi:MAG: DsbA family protein [Bacteriovoracaceae bacterium]|nr:DsbA family protein [Bacteriovoracaceae bacterium]
MKLMLSLMFIAIFVLTLNSCSEGNSEPKFVFKDAPKQGVAAKFGDIEITEAELYSGIESDIYEEEKKIFEIKYDKLKTVLIEKIMAKDPKKANMTSDEYMDKYIAGSVKIGDKEINGFIKEKNIPAEHVNEQIKMRVKSLLEAEAKKAALDNWLAKNTKGSTLEAYFKKPSRPVFEVQVGDAPVTGNKDAKVTIVEFSDFQCPFCARGAEIVGELKKKYGSKIKIAFKNFPLPFHNQAKQAAVAGLCAHEQKADKFWDMHDKMFGDQTKLDAEGLKAAAKAIGLNTDKFAECLASNKFEAKVEQDIETGKSLGIRSTPTFFVNGKLVSGAQPIEVFTELIEEDI